MKARSTNKGAIDRGCPYVFCIGILVVGPQRMLSKNRGAVGFN
jgi:hypothetical protein